MKCFFLSLPFVSMIMIKEPIKINQSTEPKKKENESMASNSWVFDR